MSNHNYKETISELFQHSSFPYNPENCVHDLLGNKKIILYGAGGGFVTFSVFILKRYGFKVHAVLDRKFKSGGIHCGIPAFSPLEYSPQEEEKENAIVVITLGKEEYHEEIFHCLRGLGFKNIILATDIYEYHLLVPLTEPEKKEYGYYLANRDQIMECLALFADDLSREIYTGCIQSHMQRKPIHIPRQAQEEQYFPKDINLRKGYSRFINCGAYNGDTVMRLNALSGKVDAIACFEPDLENFESLARYLHARHNEIARSVIAFPCAVFNRDAILRFATGNRFNSMLSDKGEAFVQCVALDHVIPGFKPTFISMDVEGVESEALKGAETLIKDNRPDLAICVYHVPSHIWDIPLYVESLHLGYKFYLRNYTGFITETVLYTAV